MFSRPIALPPPQWHHAALPPQPPHHMPTHSAHCHATQTVQPVNSTVQPVIQQAGRSADTPTLLVFCNDKKMAYAPGERVRTYDDAIDFSRQLFSDLLDVKRDDITLHVEASDEIIRVPAEAWDIIFPTLRNALPFGGSLPHVFVEVNGMPSGLPSWPFRINMQQWFTKPWADMPIFDSTPALYEYPQDAMTPPPPFSDISGPQATTGRGKRSFWSKLKALFFFGGSKSCNQVKYDEANTTIEK